MKSFNQDRRPTSLMLIGVVLIFISVIVFSCLLELIKANPLFMFFPSAIFTAGVGFQTIAFIDQRKKLKKLQNDFAKLFKRP
ncbi:MAG: hypothetical protein WCT18_01350 [Patescibacteria group bacterium]